MTGFFIALLSGALMSVQGVFNTQVTKTTGMWVSNAWVQLSAFAICLVMWLIMGRDSIATIGEVHPKYMLLGGVIGAGITWTVIKSVDALGPAYDNTAGYSAADVTFPLHALSAPVLVAHRCLLVSRLYQQSV